MKGASANSYLTQATAQTYLDGRLNVAEWTNAVTADKDRALIQAASRLELESFEGFKTTTTQRLKWPRSGAPDGETDLYDKDLMPRVVEEATTELALAYLKGEVDLSEIGLEAFKQVTVGSIAVEPKLGRRGDALPSVVRRILMHVRIGASELNVPVVRA